MMCEMCAMGVQCVMCGCVFVLCVHVKVGYAREYGDNAKECT